MQYSTVQVCVHTIPQPKFVSILEMSHDTTTNFVSVQAMSHDVTTQVCVDTGYVALCHNPFLCRYWLCRIMSQPIFVSIQAMSHDATTNFVSIQAMSHYVTTHFCIDTGYIALCHNLFLCRYRLCRIMSQPRFVLMQAMSHYATTRFVFIKALSPYATTQVCVHKAMSHPTTTQICVDTGYLALSHNRDLGSERLSPSKP